MLKINFLWDEEKTRQIHKTLLFGVTPGVIAGVVYGFINPSHIELGWLMIIDPLILFVACMVGLLFIHRTNQGLRFLFTLLVVLIIGDIYMMLTGGFRSVVQFNPFFVLLLSIFGLGPAAATIVVIVTLITFLVMIIFSQMYLPSNSLFADFFIYVSIYLAVFFVFRNIGKEMSLQFEAKKKLEQVDDLKNQFITLASHYLRTPLTVIKGSLENLQRLDSPESKAKNLEQIRASARRLDLLVEKLLTIASIDKGHIGISSIPSDLDSVITNAISEVMPFANTQNVNIHYQSPNPRLPRFPFDPFKMRDIFSNLLDNAIKFNNVGGSVWVELGRLGDMVRVTVKDSGPGIKKEQLENIFSSFNKGGMEHLLTLDKPGFGLSLYLSKLIIEAHGGTISVQSKEGQGTSFTFTIPMGDKERSA